MKKLLIASALILAGCGSKTVYVTQTTQESVIQTTTTAYQPTTDDIYLTVIYNEYPATRSLGDAYLIEVGNTLCDEIDAGLTLFDLSMIAVDMNIDPTMLGYITGAAISAYCPWNDWFFAN